MPREKAADEVFCRSCGEAIKKEAEICPNCGVRNERAETSSTSSSRSKSRSYSTTVSDSWWYGVAGGVALWVLLLILASTAAGSDTLLGFLLIIVWAGLPIATYFDMQYVRANSEWDPNTGIWVVLMAIWIANVAAGALYLYRRHEVLDEP